MDHEESLAKSNKLHRNIKSNGNHNLENNDGLEKSEDNLPTNPIVVILPHFFVGIVSFSIKRHVIKLGTMDVKPNAGENGDNGADKKEKHGE